VVLVVTAPVIAGRLVAQQRAQNLRLQELTRQLEAERVLAERTAVAEERARIARELHDVVGHEVTLIAVQSEAAAAALRTAPERATEPVDAIRETAHRTMSEMRTLLGALHDGKGEEAHAVTLGPHGLAELCHRAGRMGVPNTLSVRGTPWDGPPDVVLALNRVAQEALTNAGRHAAGSTAEVVVDWQPERVCLRIVTQLRAGAQRSTGGGLGIRGMRERVRLCGGELSAGRVGDTFVVTATLPRRER
jgi:signal transduction histidine kinase